MRQVPDFMTQAWYSGSYVGDRRPIARVTIHRPNIRLVRVYEGSRDPGTTTEGFINQNLFATLPFGGGMHPVELPNVKSVSWNRGVDIDVASCNIEFYNTRPLPIGVAVTKDLDQPGYYTYNYGGTSHSHRWGHQPNEWSGMLMPDNIIRTFEGYGFDENVAPDFDPHLVQTGEWMIDDVDYTHDGSIMVTCRDVGRILIDHIAFPPVVPFRAGFENEDLPDGAYSYPVMFRGENSEPIINHIPVSAIPGSTNNLNISYDTSSNHPYVGHGSVYGHSPQDAFDGDDSSYWLSIGNARPDQGYSFEWLQARVSNQTVRNVRFKSWKAGHTAYLSIYSDGAWVGDRIVPYDPNHPASAPNGANIPYVMTASVTSTGWTTFQLPREWSKVTRVRITFGGLQNSGLGPFPFRAGIRRFEVQSVDPSTKPPDSKIQHDVQHIILDPDSPPFPWGSSYPSPGGLGGTWRLTFRGQTTSAIAWNATAGSVKAALEGLSNIDRVNVSGSGRTGSPWIVEFVGDMVKEREHPLMRMIHNDLRHNHNTTRVSRGKVAMYRIEIKEFQDQNYQDYTDIVKLLCAWGGFYWPREMIHQIGEAPGDAAYMESEDLVRQRIKDIRANRGLPPDPASDEIWVQRIWFDQTHTIGDARTAIDAEAAFKFGTGAQRLQSGGEVSVWHYTRDDKSMPILVGRVWGDFQLSGTAGPAPIPPEVFDKKPLMDGIAYVRDILGFLFFIDEYGGVVFKAPNIYSVGNTFRTLGERSGERTRTMVTIDESQTLISMTASLSGRNLRERTFVSGHDGNVGHVAKGWNPNPIGMRRVGGWTDQHFETSTEAKVMAEMITLRQLFTFRTDSVTIPGYPAIQVDDQVRVNERVTSESFIHYVMGINSSLDHESGEYTYVLETHWLGDSPFKRWAFDPAKLSKETQDYLKGLFQ